MAQKYIKIPINEEEHRNIKSKAALNSISIQDLAKDKIKDLLK